MRKISLLICESNFLPPLCLARRETDRVPDDSYENDDSAPSKDQMGVTSQPAGQDDIKPEPSGYGEEPDTTQDNTSYDAEPVLMQTESNGYNGDDFAHNGNEISMMVEEPGIRMKEDG